MSRPRRQILSREVYEICMRTKEGLPFVCTKYMKLLIKGIMSRVQRDQKVVLCHYLWMGNHPHMIIVAKDSLAACSFHGEIKKQLTDSIKRLIGVKHLNLWKKNGTSVIRYGDIDSVKKQIAYLYANASRANLVESIEEYPGVSSFNMYMSAGSSVSSEVSEDTYWIRLPMIKRLPKRSLTDRQDEHFTEKLLSCLLYTSPSPRD